MFCQKNSPARSPKDRGKARDRLLQAADRLFYHDGIRAVGIDQVIKAADVARISLYRAFPSKDDLIVAYLIGRDQAFWQAWDDIVAGEREPLARLRAVIRLLADAIAAPAYRGCPFANFVAEFPDRSHPGHRAAIETKARLRDRLTDLCRATPVKEPERLAFSMFLMIEGAFAASQTSDGQPDVIAVALDLGVETLIRGAS